MAKHRLGRRVAWVAVAVCVVALAFGLTTRLLGMSPAVTKANVSRIRPGMSRAEVEALLGSAGKHYCYRSYHWAGLGGEAHVWFTAAGGAHDRVESVQWWTPDSRQALRSWLREIRRLSRGR
jgi:hypothetical protein